jgi:multidrug efflux pump subunit AcrA (membrane-fusion protein)
LAQTIPNALVVPALAVLTEADGGTSVMAVGSDGRVHQVSVKLGVKEADEVQILEGLQAGEKVVTVGAYGLPDKVKVNIEKSNQAEQQPAKPAAGKEPEKDEK